MYIYLFACVSELSGVHCSHSSLNSNEPYFHHWQDTRLLASEVCDIAHRKSLMECITNTVFKITYSGTRCDQRADTLA